MRPLSLRVLAALALLAAATSRAADDEPRGLDIYFIDVLGGAATLVVTPEGESVLIDSGWPGQGDRDPKRIAHVLKEVAGLDRLDHLVTTHYHVDHYGGVEGLSKRVEIGRFWDRGLPEDDLPGIDFPDGPKDDDPLAVAYRRTTDGRRKPLLAGDELPLKGKLGAMVVASGGRVFGEDKEVIHQPNPHCESAPSDKPEDRSDNARSIALLFRLGDFEFLDCGDLTWNVERKLVCPADRISHASTSREAGRPPTAIDLYQVTHHGLDSSNHPTLLRTIEPTVTIMNNGPRKGGSAEVVRLIRSLPSVQAAYQLHKNAQTGPEDNTDPALIANSDPEGGQFIHVRVEPDGKRFTVRIGADGEPRSFEAR